MRGKNRDGIEESIGFWLLAASIVLLCLPISAEESVFSGDAILDLTIRAPFKHMVRHSGTSDGENGQFVLSDGTTVPMRCSAYGISRLRECKLASLKFTFEPEDTRRTPFEGHPTLRMITPCRFNGEYDTYVVLEFLVYRSYDLLTDPSLRVHLVRASFRDMDHPGRKEESGYAFFVEDIDSAAAARNQVWTDVESVRPVQLDQVNLVTMSLFQFMVGGADWSALMGPKGDRCCHNVALLGDSDDGLFKVIPFDFDQTGVVNPPYAVPAASLGIKRVTDRVWRGYCELNDLLPATIEVFNQKRPDFEAVFLDDALPYPRDRKMAWKYIEEFYDVINNPKKLENKILSQCR